MINHGNNLTERVVVELRKLGWKALISPYYVDTGRDLPRELDIICEKIIPLPWFFGEEYVYVLLRLIIECKNLTNDIYLWLDGKDKINSEKLIQKTYGIRDTFGSNVYTKELHYGEENKVIKMFCGETEGKQSKDTENEPIFKAVNQVLNSLIFFRDRKDLGLWTEKELAATIKGGIVSFPMVIYKTDSNIFCKNIGDQNWSTYDVDYLQLETRYAFEQKIPTGGLLRSEYFLVDLLPEEKITKFVGYIEKCIESQLKILKFPGSL